MLKFYNTQLVCQRISFTNNRHTVIHTYNKRMKEERKFESKVEITNITQEIIKTETSYIPFEQNEPRKRIPKEKCQKISKWLTTMGENMKKKRKTMTVEDLEDVYIIYIYII